MHPDGLVDKLYSLWNRNPMQVKASYLSSGGKSDRPGHPHAGQLLIRSTEQYHEEHSMARPSPGHCWHRRCAARPIARLRLRSQSARDPVNGSKMVKLCDNKTTVQVSERHAQDPRRGQEDRRCADGAVGIQPSGQQVGRRRKSRRTRSCRRKTTPSWSAPASPRPTAPCRAQDVKVWNNETYKEAVYGSSVFHSGDELGQRDRGVVRHVPSARRQHASRNLSEVPTAARPRRLVARHDQLVHRAPGARQGAGAGRSEDARAGGVHPRAAQGCAVGLRQALDRQALIAATKRSRLRACARFGQARDAFRSADSPDQVRQQRKLMRLRIAAAPYQPDAAAVIARAQRPDRRTAAWATCGRRAANAGNNVQPKPAATSWQMVSRLTARKSSEPSSRLRTAARRRPAPGRADNAHRPTATASHRANRLR